VYLISDFDNFTETCVKHVSDIRRHCEVHAAHIFDPMEYALPSQAQGRTLNLKSALNAKTLTLASSSSRDAYCQQQIQKRDTMFSQLTPNVDKHRSISAGELLLDQLKPQDGINSGRSPRGTAL
jgi:hypothetical protein